jgi:hypothetical protein
MKEFIVACLMTLVPIISVCISGVLAYNNINGWWAFLLVPLFTSVRYTPDKIEKE